ncbi:hypothetical protein BH18ACT10_BH18ACT10_10210 [soil metagenome]
MEQKQAGGKLGKKILGIIITTMVVALVGALLVGVLASWQLGALAIGAITGVFSGCSARCAAVT